MKLKLTNPRPGIKRALIKKTENYYGIKAFELKVTYQDGSFEKKYYGSAAIAKIRYTAAYQSNKDGYDNPIWKEIRRTDSDDN